MADNIKPLTTGSKYQKKLKTDNLIVVTEIPFEERFDFNEIYILQNNSGVFTSALSFINDSHEYNGYTTLEFKQIPLGLKYSLKVTDENLDETTIFSDSTQSQMTELSNQLVSDPVFLSNDENEELNT